MHAASESAMDHGGFGEAIMLVAVSTPPRNIPQRGRRAAVSSSDHTLIVDDPRRHRSPFVAPLQAQNSMHAASVSATDIQGSAEAIRWSVSTPSRNSPHG